MTQYINYTIPHVILDNIVHSIVDTLTLTLSNVVFMIIGKR